MIPLKIGVLAWPVIGSLVGVMVRRGSPEGTRSFWKGLIVAHPERLSEELLRFETLAARRNVGTWLSLIRSFGSVRGPRLRYLIDPRYLVEPHLRRVAAPVTFVWGERDAFDTPDRGRQLAAATMRPGQVIVIPDAGHLPWIDEPNLVAAAILAAVSGGNLEQRPEREPRPADLVALEPAAPVR
jgi:pimeloyl-ACP methyl ester carboxylesterase